MTKDHEKSDTPMGEGSPYRKLYEYGAKILMLGCSLASTSYIHAIEEEANVPAILIFVEILNTLIGDTRHTEY